MTLPSDRVLPFQTGTGPWRGRLVRLGPVLDEILGRHDFPPAVAGLVAEVAVLTVALASVLKYDGIFTLQIKGDGPVGMVVADVVSPEPGGGPRTLRAYARSDPAALDAVTAGEAVPTSRLALTGQGWLAFTVDQGENTERYQGIVALEGASLAEAAVHYFQQSEQLPTALRVAAARTGMDGSGGGGSWRAGALMLQPLPSGAGDVPPTDATSEDDWRRAMVLMSTLSDAELLDPTLADQELLFRLFHQDDARVYPVQPVTFGCRCSRERVIRVLASLPEADRAEIFASGTAEVRCEFCATPYRFAPADLIS